MKAAKRELAMKPRCAVRGHSSSPQVELTGG
jgi:hypothetical protein